ncbi:MAG: DUF2326 domain-containing protein [Ignavibacteriae bacterium]|nr:MAG: DUF2326 domain-containing protein [Ignavibacteriota bacterium]
MLDSIFSDTGLFDRVDFRGGINIVLGIYSEGKKTTGINGIGKSTLIRLIDFCLLSGSAEKIFSQNKYSFLRKEEHSVSLKFSFAKKRYLIKRNFNNNKEILFGSNEGNLDTFRKDELKEILNNIFFPIENKNILISSNKYRSLMNFFVKDDLDNQKRIEPLNFLGYNGANTRDISIINFYLLDIPNNNIIQFDEILKKYNSLNNAKSIIENTIENSTGKSFDEIRSEQIRVDSEIKILEGSLQEYEFLPSYKYVEKELVELTSRISKKLEELHFYSLNLRKLRESYEYSTEIDTNKIEMIYSEVSENFASMVRKTLDELIIFKREIIENRQRFLLKKEEGFLQKIKLINEDISALEIQRSSLLKQLKEKGGLDSIENTFNRLVKLRSELETTINATQNIDSINEEISETEIKLSEKRRDILADLKEFSIELSRLRDLFLTILENIIYIEETKENAFFDIKPNPTSKRDNLPFNIKINIPKVDALGQSRLKLIIYDLMVFFRNIFKNRAMPDFIIHDGVYHSIAHRSMANTLNFIFHEYNKMPHFQYIVTFNEDEIEIPSGKEHTYGEFDFNWKDFVVSSYQDTEEKMIFKRIFD